MARRTVTPLIDDLDGQPIDKGNGETISFALDSQAYEINLSDENAQAFREIVARYVSSARWVGGRGPVRGRRGAARPALDYDPKQVRAWAVRQGLKVPARGRIPAGVVARFRDAAGS